MRQMETRFENDVAQLRRTVTYEQTPIHTSTLQKPPDLHIRLQKTWTSCAFPVIAMNKAIHANAIST